jgi:Sulfotransferase family
VHTFAPTVSKEASKLFGLARIKRAVKRAVKRNPTLRNIYIFRVAGLHYRARLRGARSRGELKGGEQPRSVNPENMIWIFCTARSGSTWLRSMLNDLVEGEVWEEPKVGRLFGEGYSRIASERPTQLGRVNFVLGEPTREVWTKALRNFVLQTAWASHPSITPERYLIVKEPGGAIGAPLLMDALPESRMVLLVRDPRDFAASILDALKKGGWMYEGLDGMARRDLSSERAVLRNLKLLSKQYVRQMSNGKKAFDSHEGRKILLKYDDLRGDTLGTMRHVCAALAIPVDEQRLARVVERHSWEKVPEKEKGAGTFYRKATPGGWQEDLTPEQARIVEDITAPLIEEFSFS